MQDQFSLKISVIVRTKNRPQFLPRALRSLAAQRRKPDEVIVVNDGGEDVRRITDGFPGLSIRLFQLEKSIGCPAAGNYGVRQAEGRFISFLDDDDNYLPEHLASLEECIRKNRALVAYAGCRTFLRSRPFSPEGEAAKSRELFPYNEPFDARRFDYENYIPIMSLMISRRLFEEIGGFDEQLGIFDDWDLLFRLSRRTAFVGTGKLTVEYNIWEKETQMTTTCDRKAWEAAYRNILEKNLLSLPRTELTETLVTYWYVSQDRYRRVMLSKEAVKEKNAIIKDFLGSLSWRITTPLRWGHDRAKNFWASRKQSGWITGIKNFFGWKWEPLSFLSATDPTVSIMIPVFNQPQLTYQCLRAVACHTNQQCAEVILADNGSGRETRRMLSRVSGVKILRNRKNTGFVSSCNRAAKKARGKYLVFLNNDTEVRDGWLDALLEVMRQRKDCGAAGVKLVYPDGRLQEAGGIVFSDGSACNYGNGDSPDDPKYNFTRKVDYCSAAALMVRKNLWDVIGGFDTRYAPAYYEDTDLCFEIRKRGYQVYYQPKSVVIHHEGATAGRSLQHGIKRFQEINRGKFSEKWKEILGRQYPPLPENIFKASERGAGKRILVAFHQLPMFDRASGSLRLFQILQMLRDMGFKITLIAREGVFEGYYRPVLENLGVEVLTDDEGALKSAGMPVDWAHPIAYGKFFEERAFAYAILSYWSLAEYYLPIVRRFSPSTFVIADTVDIQFQRRLREAEVKLDEKLRLLTIEEKKREIDLCRQCDRVWVVTEREKELIGEWISPDKIDVIPNIHLPENGDKRFAETSGLLFIGNFWHSPNVDAMEFFCSRIFPLIAKRLSDVRLYIVGNDPPGEIQALRTDRIIVTGYVPDLFWHLDRCRVFVCPLRYGAGMKGKIGTAMSSGLPVVTTSVGAEGMGLAHERHALIADDPEKFAAEVVRLYQDRMLWECLSAGGKAKAREWTPDRVREKIKAVFSLIPEETQCKISRIC
ncbi:MAG TPA: glycosyltransferase [Candidatus Omnitrophota bacterium]|nr:glycosyltransferase [Candidatus Omnitrophota bacterium]